MIRLGNNVQVLDGGLLDDNHEARQRDDDAEVKFHAAVDFRGGESPHFEGNGVLLGDFDY